MDTEKKRENGDVFTISSPTRCTSNEAKKQPFWHIDKRMIRFKLHFFSFIGGMGAVLPYLPVVARNRIGLSATSLAAILTTQQFITIFSKPFIGYIVDYFNKLKLVIIVLIFIQTVGFFLLLTIPHIKVQHTPYSDVQLNFFQENSSNIDKDESFIILNSYLNQSCQDYLPQDVSSNQLLNLIRRENDSNVFCIGHYNSSIWQCFLVQEEDVTQMPQSGDFCCTLYPMNIGIYQNISELKVASSKFLLSSMDPKLTETKLSATFQCSVKFKNIDYPSQSDEIKISSDFGTLEFWLFAIAYSVASTCVSSSFTLGDTACFEGVQKFGGDFGRQRLFGAVGWGTMSPIGGLLSDVTNDYVSAWIFMAALQAVAVWNILNMNMVKPHMSKNIAKDVGSILKSVEFLTFQLGVFMNGMGAGLMRFYLVWYLTSLGGSKFLCGLTQYVQCFVGEIPFMFFSGMFIKKMGHFNLLSMSLFCYALRFLWYSYLQVPWMVLPIEIMHSFTYGTYYPTVASFGKLSAKPGTEATTQSILFTTHEGLGAGLGCVLGGIGFDHIGGHKTFFYTSIFFIFALFVNILNTFLNRRHTKTFVVHPSIKN